MAFINKQDTNGTKSTLAKGELGYDDYGSDKGRVYVGDGTTNIALSKKSELDSHTSNTSNPHSVTKTQVGLGSVDNTADSAKNVLSATKLATARTIYLTGDVTGSATFDGSANISIASTIAANSVALGTDTTGNYVAGITAGTGLAVSGTAGEGWSPTIGISAVGTAGTYTKVTTNASGQVTSGTTLSASDIPSLDASKITSGTIDAARLPSYVDDVIEGATTASFPTTGETGKIYVALDTNKAYRWSGSAYVYITSGAVDSVNSKTGVVTLVKGDIGLGSVDNTADSAKNVLSATKLITARTIGMTGDVTWTSASFDGTGNVTGTSTLANSGVTAGTYTKVTVDAKGRTTSGTTLSAGDIPTLNQNTTGSSGSCTGNAATATKLVTAITINGVSFDGSANITVTDSTKQPLDADLTAIAGLTGTSGLLKKTAADTWTLDTSAYVTSSGVTSVTGTAPISSSGGTTPAISISAATTSAAGSMSAADKTKLDGIATGATANTGTVTSVATSGAITGGTITSTGTISHSTADGYLHVPATSTTNNGKVLTAGSTAGSLSWTTPTVGTVTSVVGGSYLTGGTITSSGTLAVDATSANTASKVVARDASGNFSAGTITASLSGNATTATTATTANALNTSNAYTGTSFNSITALSSTSPSMNGTAAVGTSTTVARADHIHPSDTIKANLASPTFTGTVVLPSTTSIGGNYITPFSGFKNYIINGGFDVWQRGTSFASAGNGTRVADMWSANMDGNASITYSKIVADTLNGRRVNTLQVGISSIGTTTYAGITTRIEDMMKYAGKTLTLSFYAVSDSATPINVYFGRYYTSMVYSGAINVGNGVAGGLTKYTVTFTVPDYAGESYSETNSFLEIIIRQTINTIGSFRIAQVQLEEGSVATPFEQRPYGLELSLCQRYYEIIQVNNLFYGVAGMTWQLSVPHKVAKRVNPTVVVITPTGHTNIGTITTFGNNSTVSIAQGSVLATGLASVNTGLTASSEL